MKPSILIGSLFATCLFAPSAQAQFTTVQLPTVQNFSMSTTVSVPDRGSVYMGGINRSAYGTSRRGTPLLPNTNRSFGRETSASGVHVSAYVHDFDEMDRQVRGSVASTNSAIRESAIDHRLPRVSDVRQRVRAKQAAQVALARKRIKAGVQYEKQGKYVAAKAKYRAAYSYAKPEWQVKIKQRLRVIETKSATQQVVASR